MEMWADRVRAEFARGDAQKVKEYCIQRKHCIGCAFMNGYSFCQLNDHPFNWNIEGKNNGK